MISGFQAFEKMSLQSGKIFFPEGMDAQISEFLGLNDEMFANQQICKTAEIKMLGKRYILWLPDLLLNEG